MLLSEVSNTIFNPYKNTHFPLTPNQKMDRPLVQKEVFFFERIEKRLGEALASLLECSSRSRTQVRSLVCASRASPSSLPASSQSSQRQSASYSDAASRCSPFCEGVWGEPGMEIRIQRCTCELMKCKEWVEWNSRVGAERRGTMLRKRKIESLILEKR